MSEHIHVYEAYKHRLIAHELDADGRTVCGLEIYSTKTDLDIEDVWFSDHDRDDVSLCAPCGTEADRV